VSTAFSAIVDAMTGALAAAPTIAKVHRALDRDVPLQDDNVVTVQFEAADPFDGEILGAPVDWQSLFTVDCFSRSLLLTGDLAVDPLFSEVYRRLAADRSLGGLVADIGNPRVKAENTADGKKTGWVRLAYIVQHRTANLTLE
jgi:hypothetical protein